MVITNTNERLKDMKFRDLRADEIDCRVQAVKKNGVSLLLYKDARCDMNILDETVGVERWKRSHELINGNLFCNVSIKFGDEWVTKQDVGVESYTEKQKGQASDSFKRACFNFGIGRELYTAPFIWVSSDKCNIQPKGNGFTTYDHFTVDNICIENKRIVGLIIKNTSTNRICYSWGKIEYKCSDCGKPFQECEIKGKMFNSQQVFEMAKQMSSDGKARCKECREKIRTVSMDEL